MKMGNSLFWGLLLIVLGLSLVFRIVFNVYFPIFKIFIAFVLIYLGIKILFGSLGTRAHIFNDSERDVIFSDKNYNTFEDNGDYNTVFGKSNFDFRGYDLQGQKRKLKLSTVFGGTVIKIDKDLPVRIRVESVFGGADLPNGNSAVFGSSVYESQNLNTENPYLDMKLDVVFGGVEVKTY